ncbi:flagellar protein FliT [Heyndrickxia sporothermodurans]
MSVVQECYNLTEKLVTDLQLESEKERDVLIAEVTEILEKREQLLPLIKPPFSNEEMLLGTKLVELNKILHLLLNKEKQHIQKDINGLSKKKISMNKYINPYQSMQTDGYFYDKRK